MRRMSWIAALGTMLVTACAVESNAVSPPSGAEASTVSQAVVSAEAQSSALPEDGPRAPRSFNQCIEFCPGEACCGTSTGWVCC